MQFVFSDGGRRAAGFRRENVGDCVARSISIAMELPYMEVHSQLLEFAQLTERRARKSNPSSGVFTRTYRKFIEERGWVFTPTMAIGSGCRVHLRDGELPNGRLVVRLSRHLTAVIDGVIYDTYDPSRGGTRCVYGFYSKPTGENNERRVYI